MPRVQIDLDVSRLRALTGATAEQLPDDVTDEQMKKFLTEAQGPNGAFKVPEGMVLVDEENFQTMQENAEGLEDQVLNQERDGLLQEAVAQGKIPPGRKEHFAQLYDADPQGTRDLIAQMAPNTIPVEARGKGDGNAFAASEDYPGQWLPEVHNPEHQRVIAGGD